MTLSKAERERILTEGAQKAKREAESDDQKWLRGAMRETLEELLEEKFGEPEGDEGDEPKKPSGPGVFDLTSLFGKSKTG